MLTQNLKNLIITVTLENHLLPVFTYAHRHF